MVDFTTFNFESILDFFGFCHESPRHWSRIIDDEFDIHVFLMDDYYSFQIFINGNCCFSRRIYFKDAYINSL